MRKLIFFDIDGTLAAERTGFIPESTKRALKKARENGHLLFINTGRTACSVEEEHRALGFDGYVYGCGTSVVTEGKSIFRVDISVERCREIVKLARKAKVSPVYESDERIYFDSVETRNPLILMLKEKYKSYSRLLSEAIDEDDVKFDKFCFWLEEDSETEELFENLSKDFDLIDRGKGMFEVVPKGVSKASGIQVLMDYYRIPLQDCYAVGDSTNDLAMLKFVPNSIAMGNSMQEILAYCSYQTARLEEDGIEKALKHYHII